MYRILALAVAAALLLIAQSKISAIVFVMTVIGVFLSAVFRSTVTTAGRSV